MSNNRILQAVQAQPAALNPAAIVFNTRGLNALIQRDLSFGDQVALSLTNKKFWQEFNNNWIDPQFIFNYLNKISANDAHEVRSQLPKRVLRIIKSRTIKDKNDHLSYACWALLCDDVRALDLERLSDASTYLEAEFPHLVRANKAILALRHYLQYREYRKSRKLYSDKDKENIETFVTLLNEDIPFNASHATIYRLSNYYVDTRTVFNNTYLDRSNFKYSAFHIDRTRNFAGTKLRQANFQEARLDCVNFEGADLSNAKMYSPNVSYTNFVDANLTNVDFRRTIVTYVGITVACITAIAILGAVFLVGFLIAGYILFDRSTRFDHTKYFSQNNSTDKINSRLTMLNTVKTELKKEFKASVRKDLVNVVTADVAAGTITAAEGVEKLTAAKRHPFFNTHRHIHSKFIYSPSRFFNKGKVAGEIKNTRSQNELDKAINTMAAPGA